MIAFFLAPVYLLFNFYILRWLLRWMSACSHHFKKRWTRVVVVTLYILLSTSILTAFLLPPSRFEKWLQKISNYWLGTFLYILLIVFIVDVGRMILKHMKTVNQERLASRAVFVLTGTICISCIAGLSAHGIINAHHIRTTRYEVAVPKSCEGTDSLNVVLLADFHLGYSIGTWHMKQMVKKVNQLHPDIVCIAGDIFDNDYDSLDNPKAITQALQQIQSKYGVYACYGNHDIQEKILAGFTFRHKGKKVSDQRMDQLLENANITLLQDETKFIANKFYLAGRPDYERPGRGITTRKTPTEITAPLDLQKPVLVMDHEPRELQELSDAGVDLDLCGHTHDGQMFPGNLTIKLLWENAYGHLKKGSMHNIVTSGVGVFGPYMRVGTKSEIVQIKVTFNPAQEEKKK
ncbi:MAG: metallophosphoesterase [Lachnospiraceae bacterium]